MLQLCATVAGDSVCMPVNLTAFDDPRQAIASGRGDEAAVAHDPAGAPQVRTRVASGAVPAAWPRDEQVAAELVRGQERIPCRLLVHTGGGGDDAGGVDLILIGEEVFRVIMGR